MTREELELKRFAARELGRASSCLSAGDGEDSGNGSEDERISEVIETRKVAYKAPSDA